MLALLTGIPVVGPFLAMAASPIGRWVVIALAFFVWLGVHDVKVAGRARSECQAAQLQKTVAEMTRQRDAAQAALDDAEKQKAADDAAMAKLEKERDSIKIDSKVLVSKSCGVPRAVTKRLRNIR